MSGGFGPPREGTSLFSFFHAQKFFQVSTKPEFPLAAPLFESARKLSLLHLFSRRVRSPNTPVSRSKYLLSIPLSDASRPPACFFAHPLVSMTLAPSPSLQESFSSLRKAALLAPPVCVEEFTRAFSVHKLLFLPSPSYRRALELMFVPFGP